MPEIHVSWFGSDAFLPHGYSYAWAPGVLWMQVIADALIAGVYFVIPFVLLHIARRRSDLSFDWRVLGMGIFMLACGLIHVMAILNVWQTHYWLESAIKVAAALTAIPAAALLWRSLPDILSPPDKRQLKEANESLARANRELEAFTASVSHDLRAPLTTIAGHAGLLELGLTDAHGEQKRRLARIQGGVEHMSKLIDALLELSRISRYTLHRQTIDVTALAMQIVQELRRDDPTRNVNVTIQPGMNIHGDARLIGELFQHLLANAWKFTSRTADACIDIGLTRTGTMAILHVKDNGAGFDMAYEQKLFKPFQRLHGSGEFDGFGIGLATAARIVDRHGGRIWGEGKPNMGAVFYLTLPLPPPGDSD